MKFAGTISIDDRPINPKFEIEEILKIKTFNSIILKGGKEINYIRFRVADIKYNYYYKQNVYTLICIDTVGKPKEYFFEEFIENNLINK